MEPMVDVDGNLTIGPSKPGPEDMKAWHKWAEAAQECGGRGQPRVEVRGNDPKSIVISDKMFTDVLAALRSMGVWMNVEIVEGVIRNVEMGKLPHDGEVKIK